MSGVTEVMERLLEKHPERMAEIMAHKHSFKNRDELEQSGACGCFYCLQQFMPREIVEWVDADRPNNGRTALCPHCGIDSVIGSASGYPLTEPFLERMNEIWFGGRRG